MMRILVYEFVSAGGLADADPQAEAELLPAGRSMRDAMLDDLLAWGGCELTVADSAAAPVVLDVSGTGRAARTVRAAPGQDATAFIAEQMAAHDLAWIVAPESDGLLARCQQIVGAARWLGCDAAAIRVASSKHHTLAALRSAGTTTPLDFEDAPDTARWVVKPDDGAGAVATLTFSDHAAACANATQRRAAGEAVTLEPWVAGEAMSLSLMVCPGGITCTGVPSPANVDLLSVNRQDIALTADGHVRFKGVHVGDAHPTDPRLPALQRLAEQTVRALPGLRGFVGIDLVWHATCGPVAIEVNPRVSCAYVGQSRRLGRNLAAEMVTSHAWSHSHMTPPSRSAHAHA
jgi:tyramine---L-glutamate ligase